MYKKKNFQNSNLGAQGPWGTMRIMPSARVTRFSEVLLNMGKERGAKSIRKDSPTLKNKKKSINSSLKILKLNFLNEL